ncbi:MAG: sulfite exporter TauE/SafE family protein [Clostridiales bacterium]|nr:sulfite exporter TauE/SafE family protein [Clostridiales bacterium]
MPANVKYFVARVVGAAVYAIFFAKVRKTIYMNGKAKTMLVCGGSVAVGLVSGFFGGGGGMLAVPLLALSGLDQKHAHATALLVILPICIISASIYIAAGFFDGQTVLCACIGVVLGGIVGAALLNKLNPTLIGIIFALMMIGIGIKLVIV